MNISKNHIRKHYSDVEKEYEICRKAISTALNFKKAEFKNTKDCWGDGYIFESNICHKNGKINFVIIVETELNLFDEIKEKIPPYLKLHFNYYNEVDLLLFDNSKVYSYNEYTEKTITNWVNSTIEKLNRTKEANVLNFIFGDRPFKVYGQPVTSIGSAFAFEIALKGYANMKPSEILVYKLKHYENGGYQVFSYAIFHSFRQFIYDYSFWSVFPAFCSPDSGTANESLNYVENLIEEVNSTIKVIKKEYTINYDELKSKFLEESIQFWNKYDPFESLTEQIKEIKQTVNETNVIAKQINKNQEQLEILILENPDIIKEKLIQALANNEIYGQEKLGVDDMLDQYAKITDIVEKSEYWMEKIPILAKFILLLF